jgi:methyl-accepting chemotaxis protein
VEAFLLACSIVGALAVVPLLHLARRSVKDAGEIRDIHHELASLVKETKELGENVHQIQCEIRNDQREAKSGIEDTRREVQRVNETVEEVSSAVEQVTDAIGGRDAA